MLNIDEILNKTNISGGHTAFQINNFVINREPTIQSRLWQCLRELKKRKNDILQIDLQIDESKDDIEIFNVEKENVEPDPNTKWSLYNINIRKIERRISAIKNNIVDLENRKKEIEKEIDIFVERFNELEKIEKVKPFDDEEANKELWAAKLFQEIHLRKQFKLPIDSELAKTISCLDNSTRNLLINMVNNDKNLLLG